MSLRDGLTAGSAHRPEAPPFAARRNDSEPVWSCRLGSSRTLPTGTGGTLCINWLCAPRLGPQTRCRLRQHSMLPGFSAQRPELRPF